MLKGHKAQELEKRAVNVSGKQVFLILTGLVFLEWSVGFHGGCGEGPVQRLQ